MKRGVRIEQYFLRLTVVVFAVLFFMPAVALSADIYKFERLWPALQQPWYFDYPQGLAVDSNGYVYVADKNHNRIMKLAPDGQLVASWGRFGTGNGEFSNPQGITVDSSGNVYVVDTDNNRIQMFDSKGKYKGQWGSYGTTGNGKFNFPQGGIAVDRKGYVYVADTSNHRVQKFDSNGMYKSQWGSYGDGNTQFNLPKGIAVAPNDEEVYVVDSNNHRVMKFRSDGVYIHQWGTRGEGNLQFQYPNGIAVDRYGDVYVADTSNHRILRFHDDGTFSRKCGEQGFGDGQFISPSGIAVDNDGFVYTTDYNHIQKFTSTRLEFVSKWGSDGAGNGKFNLPVGIAVNSSSIVYVADALNNRIQKFTSEGQYDIQWGSPGAGIGQFNFPTGVAIDSSGYIYVADTNNNRIQKFSPAGQYETQWGTPGVGNRQFNGPTGIAIDSSGYIYVADTGNNRIQKFSPDTQYVTEWGKTGSGDVLLNHPYGVAVGSDGYMYVADTNNNYIKKFTLNGTYERKWGGHPGDDDGDVNFPKGIAVDSEGYVYIADTTKNRIQKFDPNGNFISKYGGPGYGPGLFSTPNYLSINNDKLYIPDPLNNRVQVIKRLSISSNNKAIVVAGGGPYEGNKLWEATQTAANFAYWALMNQGFSSDRIYYLSSDKDKDLDLDGDKISDVDDYAKNTNLQAAVNWASDADNLFVYLVDHGGVDQNGNGTFRMDETEMLSVSQLDSWLGTYQNQPCPTSYLMNESFENGLPAGWTVIDNAGSGAVWRFDDPLNRGNQTGGSGSFAIADSDNAGAVNMNTEMRTPVLNMSNMSTVKLEFRTDFRYYSSGGAEVADVDVSVNGGTDWSTVWHKTGADYRGPHTESIDITGTAAGKNSVIIRFHYYGANYDWWWQVDDVKISGTITSNILAQSFENGLPPGWTVVDNALSGAVWRFDDPGSRGNLTGGPGNFAIADSDNAGAVNMNTELRTPVLDMSGMSTVKLEFRTDFRYYSSGGAEVADVDVSVNGGTDWSTVWQKTGADYRGPKTEVVDISSAAGQNNVMIRFHYYNAAYDWWWQIDDVKISGASTSNSCRQVTFVYDACKSGSFLTALNTPPSGKKRVLVSSASSGESSYFVNQGSVSFSNFFWTDVFNGSNVKEAFDNATSALTTAIDNQTPLLNDGALAQTTYIGNGAIISGDMPTIGSISASAPTQSTATLTADNVTDRDGIARVWAVILPPGYASGASNNTVSGLPSIELMPVEGTLGQYTATYDKFNIADSYGTYNISIYAKDRIGNTSMPMTTTVAVGTPLKRRAIILAGGSQSDANWDGIQKGAQAAYNALKFQGYKDDSEQGCTNNEDICLYSPVAFTSGFDGTSTLSNLQSAIQTWGADSVEDVVLYMIGNGDAGSFNIKGTEPQETLTATQLDTWLDTLQNTIPGKVTVIYDASYSGAFNSKLADPNRDRILIGSSGGQAYFLSDGDISFSNYFWKRIMNGWNVRDAFYNARSAMEFSTAQEQKAWIDDNGNGTGNESSDGSVAFNYTIGVGIRLAGKDPMIGSVSAIPNTLTGALSTLIRADDVTTVGTLAAVNPVWAVVTSPKGPGDSEGSQTIVVLSDVGNNRYEGSTGNIFNAFGKYEVAVFAKDDAGDISSVSQTTVYQKGLIDKYEDDDIPAQANVIKLNYPDSQQHNFHDSGTDMDGDGNPDGDWDWVMFYGIAGQIYHIDATNLGSNCDTVLALYHESNMGTPVASWDNAGNGAPDEHSYTVLTDGIYYLKVRNSNPNVYGNDTGYDLDVYIPDMPTTYGVVNGTVTDTDAPQTKLGGVVIRSSRTPLTAISDPGTVNAANKGKYEFPLHDIGSYTLSATVSGYSGVTGIAFSVSKDNTTPIDFAMAKACTDGDTDGYGNPGSSSCLNGNALDCNDGNGNINPGVAEVCDGVDNNCNWVIDEGYDIDGDGVSDCFDSDIDGDGILNGSDNCDLSWPARVVWYGGTEYFSTMQGAYDWAEDGDEVQCQYEIIYGDVYIDDLSNKTVTFKGGYDCTYSTTTGVTIINGNMHISKGKLMINSGKLKVQ